MRSASLAKLVRGAALTIAFIATTTFLLEHVVSNARRAQHDSPNLVGVTPFTAFVVVWVTCTKVALIMYGMELYPALFKETEFARGQATGEVALKTSEGIVLVVAEIVLMVGVDTVQLLPWPAMVHTIVAWLLCVVARPPAVSVEATPGAWTVHAVLTAVV